jgi:hypothetical protein
MQPDRIIITIIITITITITIITIITIIITITITITIITIIITINTITITIIIIITLASQWTQCDAPSKNSCYLHSSPHSLRGDSPAVICPRRPHQPEYQAMRPLQRGARMHPRVITRN